MKQTDKHSGDEVLIHSEQILTRLLDQIWHVLLVVLLITGVGSFVRIMQDEPQPMHYLFIGLLVVYQGAYLMRRQLSFSNRVNTMLVLFYCVGFLMLLVFGMVAAGAWWLIMSSLLAAIFLRPRSALIHAGISTLAILLAGGGYISGLLTLPFDASVYVREYSTWFVLVLGCVLLSMLIFSAIASYQRAMLGLLREVTESRRKLKESEKEISTLRSFIPICAACKQVRDDQGFWASVDDYLHRNNDMNFSHCMCPDCGRKLYGEAWDQVQRSDEAIDSA